MDKKPGRKGDELVGKKKYFTVIVILLAGVFIGGLVAAGNTGLPLASLFFGKQENASPPDLAGKTAVAGNTPVASVADIAEKAGPAVVNVEARVQVNTRYDPFFNDPFFRDFFGSPGISQPRYETGIGTGFIISEDGYIVTNQHVINDAASISVKLSNRKDSVPARLVGQDYELDLAVLKIDGDNYPTLPMGDSNRMRVGDWVVAIGQPFGLDHTVTAGVISAKGRPITIEDRNYKNLIQTDAAINPGNSGGPLLNMQGQVIGINTAVSSQAQGIGFAIPINTVKDVLTTLKKGEKVIRPYVGVKMLDVNEEVINELGLAPDTKGVLIAEVMSGSPAARAGLRRLDIIKKIGDQVITTGTEVQRIVEKSQVGDRIQVGILREGREASVEVVLQAKP